MRAITARRRHPAAGYAVILLALLLAGLGYATVTGMGSASAAAHSVTRRAAHRRGKVDLHASSARAATATSRRACPTPARA